MTYGTASLQPLNSEERRMDETIRKLQSDGPSLDLAQQCSGVITEWNRAPETENKTSNFESRT